LASAAFHISGGTLALCATRGQAAGPGFFAAPGVLGLALGGLLAAGRVEVLWLGLGLLLLCGASLAAFSLPALPYSTPHDEPLFERHHWIMLALLAAIALRSAVWSLVELWVQGNWTAVLLLASAAAGGKLLGGLLADQLGWRRWTVGALLGAAALLTLASGNLAALVLGVALLQSATPVVLTAVAGQLPRYPATASGLALGLAIAAGGLPFLLGWGNVLGSPPVLSVLAALAGILLWFTLRRPHAKASKLNSTATSNPLPHSQPNL
jgi:FSR family fosmidomycin resistance protein-like MFS transporter